MITIKWFISLSLLTMEYLIAVRYIWQINIVRKQWIPVFFALFLFCVSVTDWHSASYGLLLYGIVYAVIIVVTERKGKQKIIQR